MDYRLAKELKEAGFPWGEKCCDAHELGWLPTLSELIEACGNQFNILQNASDDFGRTSWLANYGRDETEDGTRITNITEMGATPEEAVARLWLALNRKEE